jgi:hypothetical protein
MREQGRAEVKEEGTKRSRGKETWTHSDMAFEGSALGRKSLPGGVSVGNEKI